VTLHLTETYVKRSSSI